MKKLTTTFTILFLIAVIQGQALAQNALTDADRSVIAFEINIEQLVANAKAKEIDIAQFLQSRVDGPLGSLKWKDIKQIQGAFNLPQSRSEIEALANYGRHQASGRAINSTVWPLCYYCPKSVKQRIVIPRFGLIGSEGTGRRHGLESDFSPNES